MPIAALLCCCLSLSAQERGQAVNPDAYLQEHMQGGVMLFDTLATVKHDTFRVVQYADPSENTAVVAFLRLSGKWLLVEEVKTTTHIQSELRAVVQKVDAKGIHLDVYREGDNLVERDWVLGITRKTLVPEHYSEAWKRWEFHRGFNAADAVLLSSHLWWQFREDPMLDVINVPNRSTRIQSAQDYYRLKDSLGNEVGQIDIVARLYPGNSQDWYLLVSAYFESGSEWPGCDEHLVHFSEEGIKLVDLGYQLGHDVRELLRKPEEDYPGVGTESTDLWFRLSPDSPSVWMGCRYDPAFSEIEAVNGVPFLEELKYKSVELVWNPQKASFEVGQKILR